MDDRDRFRFVHDLFEFNDLAPANHSRYYFNPAAVGQRQISRPPRKLLVSILAFCLMPNHYHLILKQIKEGGIIKFMQKFGTGYTMYFNQKNARTGALFAGTFKSNHIADDRYLKHLISYVHLNPAELFEPGWKEKIGDLSKVEKRLREYPYSSLPEFLGHTRPHRVLLGNSAFELFDKVPTMGQMVRDARTYETLNV